MKTQERLEARRIRSQEGESIKQIARRLGVSPSSVSLWVRDIELTAEQHAALQERCTSYNGQTVSAQRRAARARRRREGEQEQGRILARRGIPLHLAGCMLFWAEGARARNSVVFANSDPEMVRLFLRFLRHCYRAPDNRIAVTCNLFADHVEREREIEEFWLETLQLPRTCLRRSIVNVYSKHSQKKRRNKLPYGTCRLVYNDTATVQSIYGAIQEYAGFDRPAWLD
jgi:transposase-like protein